MVHEYIIAATVLVSLASLAGILVLRVKDRLAKKILFFFVSFSAGTLLGSAFLDLLPEAISESKAADALLAALMGVMVFFVIEKVIHWHHHHTPHKKEGKRPKPLGYLNLLGDGLHNFFDGAAIAASFFAGMNTGIATTLAVLLHEIPQEIGDYSLLLYSGFSRAKAIMLNLLSALLAIAGAFAFIYFSEYIGGLKALSLAFTAGMFIYIASSDLVPELHKETDPSKSLQQLVFIVLGIVMIWLIATFLEA